MSFAVRIWDQISNSTNRPKVSVIIPVLNEARNLPYVAARIPRDVDEVVVVNGKSTDNSAEVALALWPNGIHVQQTRSGKGNALACGFAASTGDILVMIDADGSTNPLEIPKFIGALMTGADFAKGSRFLIGGGSVDITGIRQMGNKGLGFLCNLLFHVRYTDLCYGYNAFWRPCLDSMRLPSVSAKEAQWGDGFEIETLMNIRVAAKHLRIFEVGSFESHRIHGVSNLNAYTDGFRVLRTIWREYLYARATGTRRPANLDDLELIFRREQENSLSARSVPLRLANGTDGASAEMPIKRPVPQHADSGSRGR